MSHGTRCFGCGGRGWQFTKRGAAAQKFFADSLCIPARDVQPGMTIRTSGVPGIEASKWMRVNNVDANSVTAWRITKDEDDNEVRTPLVNVMISGLVRKFGCDWTHTEDYGYGVPADTLVRVVHSADEKRAKAAAALAYQATLTLKGEPRKRNAAA